MKYFFAFQEEQGISPKQVSFIAALFKSADTNETDKESSDGKENKSDSEKDSPKHDDFLFALFIAQEPDPQLLPNEAGNGSSNQLSSNATSLLLTARGERENRGNTDG